MAPTIASPVPQPRAHGGLMRKDISSLQSHEDGRGTPLPQYEKTASVPFTLTLQEEKNNPGQFQLVVNVDPQHQKPTDGSPLRPSASKKLIANLKELPSLGYDVSPLYHTQKSSPPSSPLDEPQGWSELDAIPPELLQKVVPDWKITFSRSDSTASTQSRKLADIKARIKKSGKGFVVRLLKGSNTESAEVAEVHLGQKAQESEPTFQELDSQPRAELDATEPNTIPLDDQSGTVGEQNTIFEIGTSGEAGIQKPAPPPPSARIPSVPQWLSQTTNEPGRRTSILEEGFSDAETLFADVRSIADRLEEQADLESFLRNSSVFPTRSGSVSSIVKTPTRGLSVVGQVRRVEKSSRARAKGKAGRSDLNRSGAHKSVKRRSPRASSSDILTTGGWVDDSQRTQASWDRPVCNIQDHSESSDEHGSADTSIRQPPITQPQRVSKKTRHSSMDSSIQTVKKKSRLKLQTNVSGSNSTNTSPVTRRRRSPRTQKEADESPDWLEVDPSDKIREALNKAFGAVEEDNTSTHIQQTGSIPKIQEPISESEVGEIPIPAEFETKLPPPPMRSPLVAFMGLAISALLDKGFEGIQELRKRYGSEPPVPPKHVRVRWTCSCGEQLYDDFIERRPGAARLLEAFLNRPRTHSAPTSPTSRTSTSTSISSLFDSNSRASTLATPESTYGGPSFWGSNGDSSKLGLSRYRNNNPSNIRMADESWLLTCANEGRFTPKIVHVDVNEGRIKSDKDLALALREHYERLNRRWLKWARLRGLTTIEFVQFEVHRNRFADIRATPSMPPISSPMNEKSPSHHPYDFQPIDLLPPVGSTYLLHLFQHPEDYDGEIVTYARAPKRRERLETGMGWGINLVEGFLAQKVWAVIMACFGIGSAVFAILWTFFKGDVQGAFGVAGWVVTLAGLMLAGLQAWLD